MSEISDEDSLSSTSELQLSLLDESTDESPARRKTPDTRCEKREIKKKIIVVIMKSIKLSHFALLLYDTCRK